MGSAVSRCAAPERASGKLARVSQARPEAQKRGPCRQHLQVIDRQDETAVPAYFKGFDAQGIEQALAKPFCLYADAPICERGLDLLLDHVPGDDYEPGAPYDGGKDRQGCKGVSHCGLIRDTERVAFKSSGFSKDVLMLALRVSISIREFSRLYSRFTSSLSVRPSSSASALSS